ncbi:MAG: BTAD domain-containing putative transcriptional regulator [Chloroflexota bacterium]
MGLLSVSLFGCVKVNHEQDLVDVKLTHSTQGLLAYLILFRHRSHPREVLTEIFWGDKDPDRSRRSLNTAIWQLRGILEPRGVKRGTYLVSDHQDEISFNQDSPFWLDVQTFNEGTCRAAAPGLTDIESIVPELEKAIALYRGDLLEGFYADWALRERETLRSRYLSTMIFLMDVYCKRGDFEKSISCGRKILEMDPLREEIHRKMMRMYLDGGQRAQAMRQYEICKEALARELQIVPMQETRDLYETSLSITTSPLMLVRNDTPDLITAFSTFHQAQAAFEKAQHDLLDSIQAIERLVKK